MIINTRSWHYKLWKWTYATWGSYNPDKTNLCFYVQRLFWLTLPSFIATTLYYVGGAIIMFWFGWYPETFRSDSKFDQFWLPSVYGVKLYPFYLLIVGVEYLLWRHRLLAAIVMHSVFVLMGVMVCCAIWYHQYKEKQEADNAKPPNLLVEWLSAKKQRVCPLIEFEKK